MKVADLEGTQLDHWVAKAQGWLDYPFDSIEQGRYWHTDPARAPFGRRVEKRYFNPSTEWEQGGPIIEREGISVQQFDGSERLKQRWNAYLVSPPYKADEEVNGPTPLVAAMRAYVASKFGDEVPDTDGA